MPFPSIVRARVPEQVAGALRDAILSGEYAPGDSLPTERALAAELGVNRSSVREALRHLEGWGLVTIRHGAGAKVADFLATAGLQLLPFLLAPGGRLDPALLRDLLELRVVLLGWTAAQAARRADPAEVEALAETLTELEAAASIEDLQALDYRVFQQLVALSENRVLLMLSNAIARVYMENRALFSLLYAGGLDTVDHRRVVDALRARDASAAGDAMTAYAQSALRRLQ